MVEYMKSKCEERVRGSVVGVYGEGEVWGFYLSLGLRVLIFPL